MPHPAHSMKHYNILRILRTEHAQPYPGVVYIGTAALGAVQARSAAHALRIAHSRYPEMRLQLCVEEIVK